MNAMIRRSPEETPMNTYVIIVSEHLYTLKGWGYILCQLIWWKKIFCLWQGQKNILKPLSPLKILVFVEKNNVATTGCDKIFRCAANQKKHIWKWVENPKTYQVTVVGWWRILINLVFTSDSLALLQYFWTPFFIVDNNYATITDTI